MFLGLGSRIEMVGRTPGNEGIALLTLNPGCWVRRVCLLMLAFMLSKQKARKSHFVIHLAEQYAALAPNSGPRQRNLWDAVRNQVIFMYLDAHGYLS